MRAYARDRISRIMHSWRTAVDDLDWHHPAGEGSMHGGIAPGTRRPAGRVQWWPGRAGWMAVIIRRAGTSLSLPARRTRQRSMVEGNTVGYVLKARKQHHAAHATTSGPRCCHEYPVLAS